MARPRPWVWLQLILGWLPVWALYTTLIVAAHSGVRPVHAALIGLRAVGAAAILGLAVHRFTDRYRWPHPFRLRFVAVHLVAAAVFSRAGLALTSASESVIVSRVIILATPNGIAPLLILGVWLYVMVAGVAYATLATERAARAEAIAARSQLAALRSQLNPHFLFNALHTVVQLIPREPRRAAEAAEQLAGLLRTTIEEDRDLVTLASECDFVERYLAIERIRFGERLVVELDVTDAARAGMVPSFSLQTLVENAVRHGAAPRIEPTTLTITGRLEGDELSVVVRDRATSPVAPGVAPAPSLDGGTGLARLRDRLAALYDGRARLELAPAADGFTASLSIPQPASDGDDR